MLTATLAALAMPTALAAAPEVPMLTATDLRALAAVITGEARGECRRGQEAVACVVLNRVRSQAPLFAGDTTIVHAAYRPHQFRPQSRKITADALNVAAVAYDHWLRGQDPSVGATAFCASWDHPRWSQGLEPVAAIGGHRFFRLV